MIATSTKLNIVADGNYDGSTRSLGKHAQFRAWCNCSPEMQREMVPKKPDPSIKRDLEHGWMMPMLWELESLMWGRWNYWGDIMLTGQLPPEPIPQIDFDETPYTLAMKMLDASLNCINGYGDWHGWGSFDHFNYFLDWLLFGFGDPAQPEPPKEGIDQQGASNRLYQVFNLGPVLLHPHDYMGTIAADNRYGQSQGFYPTPHQICHLMSELSIPKKDCRREIAYDPAIGTGRTLLYASNHCLRLKGQDISMTMVKACKVNMWLYAPWGAISIPDTILDKDDVKPEPIVFNETGQGLLFA
jgi:hypothetical protein